MSDDTRTNEELVVESGKAETNYYRWPSDANWEKRQAARAAILSRMSSPSHDRAMAEGGWQSIESAPKNGNEILLSDHGDVYAGFWSPVENYRSWADPDGNWYAEMDRGNEATAKPQRPEFWRSMQDLAPPTPTTKEETA